MQIGIGEWKARDGSKKIIGLHRPGHTYPWVGWDAINSNQLDAWTDDGGILLKGSNNLDLISPWTSPIATGHNPDKLTEEQVGVKDGWRLLDEDEIHCNHQIRCMSSWVDDGAKWIEDTWGASRACTYRTRLSREELAALDKPKKRLIRVEELPAVCWVMEGSSMSNQYLLSYRNNSSNHIGIGGELAHHLSYYKDKNFQWSSDLKNWNSFEVEDK